MKNIQINQLNKHQIMKIGKIWMNKLISKNKLDNNNRELVQEKEYKLLLNILKYV